MTRASSAPRTLVEFGQRAHVQDLLGRYPDVSVAENAEILHFLTKGPQVEVGLMTADEALQPKLRQFREDHPNHFAIGAKEYLIVAVLVLAMIGACFLLWDAGVH